MKFPLWLCLLPILQTNALAEIEKPTKVANSQKEDLTIYASGYYDNWHCGPSYIYIKGGPNSSEASVPNMIKKITELLDKQYYKTTNGNHDEDFFNHKNENCMAEITFEFEENFHWEFENKEGKISLVGWADAIRPNPENNNRIWKYKTASTTETIPYWKQKDPPTAIKGSVGHTKNIKADTIPDTVPKGVYPLENFSVGGWAPPTEQEVQQIITQNFDIVKNPICRILQSKNISHHLDIPQTPSLACDGQGFSMNSKLTYHHQVSIGASDETYDEEENYLTFHGFPIIEYAFQQKEKYIHPHNIVMMNNKHILFALGSNNNLKTHYFRMAEINDKGGLNPYFGDYSDIYEGDVFYNGFCVVILIDNPEEFKDKNKIKEHIKEAIKHAKAVGFNFMEEDYNKDLRMVFLSYTPSIMETVAGVGKYLNTFSNTPSLSYPKDSIIAYGDVSLDGSFSIYTKFNPSLYERRIRYINENGK